MKTNHNNNSKKKTVKAVIILIALCLVGGVFGFFVGSMSGVIDNLDLTALKSFVKAALIYATPVALIAVFAIVTLYTLISYIKARKATSLWDGEDEDYIDKVEAKLGVTISVLTIGMIMVYTLFGVNIYAQFNLASGEVFLTLLPLLSISFVIMIATIVYNTVMQRACVQLIKKINPEKKGEALALNFQKEWEESMDEAQKLMAFEAGYRTYKVMNYAILIAWLICTLGIMYGMSLMPLLIVSALWLTMTVTYTVYGYKIEHKNKKR